MTSCGHKDPEAHAASCGQCAARAAAFRATGDALRDALLRKADGADFTRLADKVMARLPAAPPPFWERTQIWVREMVSAHKLATAGLAAAAAAVVTLGPFAMTGSPGPAPVPLAAAVGPEEMEPRGVARYTKNDAVVSTLEVENGSAVVYRTRKGGMTVIWLSEETL
jgi:hypothetical protein